MSPMLYPDPAAEEMAERMVRSEATMFNVLDETVTPSGGGIKESGRTACGGLVDVTGPLKRFPRSVDLKECSMEAAGTWHTHVTEEQLLDPEHSLPDIANVTFGSVDASIVAGAETSDVLVAAEDRSAMVDEFQNVLGLEVESTRDVVDAQEDGRIPDSPEARRAVRSAFAPLFRTYDTRFPEIKQRVGDLTSEGTVPAYEPAGGIEAMSPTYAQEYARQEMHEGKRRHPQRFREKARRVNRETSGMKKQLADTVFSSAVGMATRRALTGLL